MTDLKTFGVHPGEGRYHEEIIYSLALLYNILTGDISNYLKSFHMTIGKLNILMAIKHQGGKDGIRQVDISKHLIVTPSNMTKMLDKLENEGLVTREGMAGDRRVNLIRISKKGSDMLDRIWPGYNERLQVSLQALNKNEQRQLAKLLTGWLEKS